MDDKTSNGLAFALAIFVVVGMVSLMAIVAVCMCVKHRQAKRLDKAKAYFNSLKTDDDGDQLDVEDDNEDQSEPTNG